MRSARHRFGGTDGIDDDGLIDTEDPGCAIPSSPAEDPACQNGRDDDWDGFVDFPEDPGCARPSGLTESPACQDGFDDDGDGAIDFDGGASANHGVAIASPDPDCVLAHLPRERAPRFSCGLGAEVALMLPALPWLRRRARRRG